MSDIPCPFHCCARWCAENKVLIVCQNQATQGKERWARGLTKCIKYQIMKGYSARKALKSLPRFFQDATPSDLKINHDDHNDQKDHKEDKSGMARGNDLDRLISNWVLKRTKFPPIESHPAIQQLNMICQARGWTPQATQVPVGCWTMRIATMIDLICTDHQGRFILIEIKWNYDKYYDVHDQGLMHGLSTRILPCSIRYQHLLQLSWTCRLFAHQQQLSELPDGYLVRFHPMTHEAQVIPIPIWWNHGPRAKKMHQEWYNQLIQPQK